jgi:hypothetical protein|uniref:Uncharacterized protein n=1 Tax=viral metagenome TaxID=1070528 RepID=A0A6C0DXH7_9ZZZZ
MVQNIDTQNDILLTKLMIFYKETEHFDKMISIINGTSKISLRIVDWFVTNYSKKNYCVIENPNTNERFKVYNDYKLKLKAYSKKKFDPFCRWDRINVPYKDTMCVQTTLGQLNFFKWTIENNILEYIENNYSTIENDMNLRNSSAKVKNTSINSNTSIESSDSYTSTSSQLSSSSNNSTNSNKTRKKREELSLNASKIIKKEFISTTLVFN